MPNDSKRLAVALPLAVYLLALTGFVLGSPFALSDFPLDDSWIHRVYAESFASGRGLAYNEAQETGATSPLWVVVSAPAHWIGFMGTPAVVVAVKALGALFGAIAVAALAGIVRRWTGSTPAAAVAGCLLAVEPRLLFSAMSGMEVPLLAALWLGAGWAALARRPLVSAALLGLAPVARPEAALAVPFGLAAIAVVLGPRELSWRRLSTGLALVAWPSLCWSLFCRSVNGHWLPNTFYVKAQPFSLGSAELATAWNAVAQHGWGLRPFVLLGLIGVALRMLKRERAAAVPACLLLAAPLAYLLGVVGSRTLRLDGYYWVRYVEPAALIVTAAFAAGAASLLTARFERAQPGLTRRRATAISLVALAALLAALPGFGRSWVERRTRLSTDSRAIHMMNVAAAEWIRDNTPARAIVGVADAGAIRYIGRRETIDLAGLNNSDVAFRRLPLEQIVLDLDYVAIFPKSGAGVLLRTFDVRKVFELPPDEYTICDCPTQTTKVIAERRGGARSR